MIERTHTNDGDYIVEYDGDESILFGDWSHLKRFEIFGKLHLRFACDYNFKITRRKSLHFPPQLKVLTMSRCTGLTDTNLAMGLQTSLDIEEISINSCGLRSIKQLAKFIASSRVKYLELGEYKIKDWKPLMDALNVNKTLRHLKLNSLSWEAMTLIQGNLCDNPPMELIHLQLEYGWGWDKCHCAFIQKLTKKRQINVITKKPCCIATSAICRRRMGILWMVSASAMRRIPNELLRELVKFIYV